MDMMHNFMTSVWIMTTLGIFMGIVTTIRRLYRWYSIVQGGLEPGPLSCKYLCNYFGYLL